ncbi:serine hydrolase [Aureispira anguillae]|uniref:Serine hydrolase n=1 Tax=Aureispira anguillae TaxID=2864201 RepID=A0A915YC23_9BACT|nr:serine hydrolase [Aureispira anguillae]BDS10273.1 serine hydrolase [Aureispira anguillae]
MKYLILVSLLLGSFHFAKAQINKHLVDSLGFITLQKTKTTGAYLAIQKDGARIYAAAFGHNALKKQSLLNDSTCFPISSNTKAFNSILLSQLVAVKELDFNTPLKTYLPDLAFKNDFIRSEVTLMDLLTHRFGFPRYDFTYYLLSEEEKENANEAVFKKLKYLEPTTSFRTQFQYGNNQYIIAAYLLEQIKQEKWEHLLQRKLLNPLKMNQTHCDLNQFIHHKNKSLGYQNGKEIAMDYGAALYEVSGMGNMFSTINDLEKWCNFLIEGNDSILPKEWIDYNLMGHFSVGYEEPYAGFSSLQYGLGWFVFDYYGHKVALHHGDNLGHQSIIVLLPDDNISWVMIANEGMSANSFPFRMTFALLDQLVGKKTNDWNQLLERESSVYYRHPETDRVKNTSPQLKLNAYQGEYVHEGFGTIKIYLKGNKLQVEAGSYTEELEHWEHESFRAYSKEFKEDAILKFVVNKEGEIVCLKTDLIEPQVDLIEFVKR